MVKPTYRWYLIVVASIHVLCSGCIVRHIRIIDDKTALAPRSLNIDGGLAVSPLQMIKGSPKVEVMINGQGPFLFDVDTGCTGSSISASLMKRLSLPESRSDFIVSAGEKKPAVCIRELRIGKATLKDYLLESRTYDQSLGVADGILGLNAFVDCQLQLDFPKKEMRLLRQRLPDSPDDKTCFKLEQALRPVVHITFQDDQGVSRTWAFLVDTGFSGPFELPGDVTEHPFKVIAEEDVTIANLSGFSRETAMRIRARASMGQYELTIGNDEIILLIRRSRDNGWAGLGRLGMPVLQGFVLSLDHRTGTMTIRTPHSSEPPATRPGRAKDE